MQCQSQLEKAVAAVHQRGERVIVRTGIGIGGCMQISVLIITFPGVGRRAHVHSLDGFDLRQLFDLQPDDTVAAELVRQFLFIPTAFGIDAVVEDERAAVTDGDR